eukprot:m51a1_g808 hypothetical protein (273) ;mRNA; f:666941-667872
MEHPGWLTLFLNHVGATQDDVSFEGVAEHLGVSHAELDNLSVRVSHRIVFAFVSGKLWKIKVHVDLYEMTREFRAGEAWIDAAKTDADALVVAAAAARYMWQAEHPSQRGKLLYFVAFEFVPGKPLSTCIQTLDDATLLHGLDALLGVYAIADPRGEAMDLSNYFIFCHGDLKPDQILFHQDSGKWYLLDLGLSWFRRRVNGFTMAWQASRSPSSPSEEVVKLVSIFTHALSPPSTTLKKKINSLVRKYSAEKSAMLVRELRENIRTLSASS